MPDLDGYSVRMGTREDADAILALINLVQPDIPWSTEHFLWQFFGGVGRDGSLLYLVLSGDDVVSLYAGVRKQCYVRGQVREGLMVQDVMTHPDHRGRGFLHHLAGLCVDTIVANGYYAYTFPNKLSENSFRRSGWTELGGIPLRTVSVDSLDRDFGPLDRDLALPVARFDERATRIWTDSGLVVGAHRDAPFLTWRYSRPGTRYFRFYLKEDRGFLVLKVFDRGDRKLVHLLDLVVSEESRSLVEPTLGFVGDFARHQGADSITGWLPREHPYSSAFDEFGLLLDPDSDRFCFVMAPERDAEVFSSADNWHLTQGDSDIY